MLRDLYFWSTPESLVLVSLVAAVATGLVAAISYSRGADRRTIRKRLERVWLGAALGAAAILTLQPGPDGVGEALPALLNPLTSFSPRDALANLVLYVPVGFFAALVWRSSQRPIVRATMLAFAVSLAIEFAQLTLPIGRSAQVYDVIFNTAGGWVGGAIGALVVGQVQHSSPFVGGGVRSSD